MQVEWSVCPWASAIYAGAMIAAEQSIVLPAEKLGPMRQAVASLPAILQSPDLRSALWNRALAVATDELTPDVIWRSVLNEIQESLPNKLDTSVYLPALLAATDSLSEFLTVQTDGFRDEMMLRIGPLRQLWEARGPGLMHSLNQTLGGPAIVEHARISGVYPITGGGGIAHPSRAVATIEAVLANPWDQLPEVVRLGWLLSQLSPNPLVAHAASDKTPGMNASRVLALAMIPAVLTAAQHVELAYYHPRTIELAISHWFIPRLDHAAQLAAVLDDWWQRHTECATAWPESLVALHRAIVAGAHRESA